jgi:hypothetical protein
MSDHLGDLLERAADCAPPLRADLVSDSMRRGRVLRRRRAAVRAVALATPAVLLVLAGVWSTSPSAGPRVIDHDAPPVARRTTPPQPALTLRKAVDEAFARYGDLSKSRFRVSAQYAEASATLTERAGTATGVSAGVSVDLRSSQDVEFPASTLLEAIPTSCAEVPSGDHPGFRCEQVDDLLVVDYRVRTDDSDPQDGAYARVVEVLHPDASVTGVRSYNSPGYGERQTIREPLLGVSQLRAIALDPVWSRVRLDG